MSLRLRPGHRVFIFNEYVDMRSGFNRLSMFIREKMSKNILEGDLFIFLGKNRKRLKALCFDGTGLLLIAKRLERGSFMSLSLIEDFEVTEEELDQIFSGSLIRRRKFGEAALTLGRENSNLDLHEADRAGNKYRSSETILSVATKSGR